MISALFQYTIVEKLMLRYFYAGVPRLPVKDWTCSFCWKISSYEILC